MVTNCDHKRRMKLEVKNFDRKIDGGLEFMTEDANSRNVSVPNAAYSNIKNIILIIVLVIAVIIAVSVMTLRG